jgi:hypothetical protein
LKNKWGANGYLKSTASVTFDPVPHKWSTISLLSLVFLNKTNIIPHCYANIPKEPTILSRRQWQTSVLKEHLLSESNKTWRWVQLIKKHPFISGPEDYSVGNSLRQIDWNVGFPFETGEALSLQRRFRFIDQFVINYKVFANGEITNINCCQCIILVDVSFNCEDQNVF